MKTIMVTGVGAIIGYGVLRSLRQLDDSFRLIGSDIYPDAIGQVWCDQFIQAPLVSSNHYANWLKNVINSQRVDLVIPAIEQDLHFFSDNRSIFEATNCIAVLNSAHLINLSRDKWLMYKELLSIDHSSVIPSYLEGSFTSLVHKMGLPFLLKPRKGYASKGIIRVTAEHEFLKYHHKLGDELMAQPIVGHDDEEYTVSIFSDGSGKVLASITLRRVLSQAGSTAKAWVCHLPTLDQVVKSLCEHFKPIGPTNLQFRKEGEYWKLLEINPRISSATSLRTAFGYNESEMCIHFFLDHLKVIQPTIKSGFAQRFIEDYITYDRNNF